MCVNLRRWRNITGVCACVWYGIQELQPIDLTDGNKYADPKFVFYDRKMIKKCRSRDPVSLWTCSWMCQQSIHINFILHFASVFRLVLSSSHCWVCVTLSCPPWSLVWHYQYLYSVVHMVCDTVPIHVHVHIILFAGTLQYNAQSPDEAALVAAAKNFGYVFKVYRCAISRLKM